MQSYFLLYLIMSYYALSNCNKMNCVADENNTIKKTVIFGIGAITGSFFSEFGKKIYNDIVDWTDYYFNHKKNLKYFFYQDKKNIPSPDLNFNDFFMQQSKIPQLKKIYTDFFENNSIVSNKIIVETEDTYNKNFFIREILFIKTIAKKMNLKLIEINLNAINHINKEIFIKTLKRILTRENNFFLINIDMSFNDYNFDMDLFLNIINIFNEFPESMLCLKINKYFKLPKNISKGFADPIYYWKINPEEMIQFFNELINLHLITLENISIEEMVQILSTFSYYDFLTILQQIENSIKENNLLTKNIFFDLIKKYTLQINKKNIKNHHNEFNINDFFSVPYQEYSLDYIKHVNFNTILGYEEIKKKLLKVTNMLNKNPLAKIPGILLYGPPGTGKTKLVQGLAGETNLPIMIIKSESIIGKYQGEAEKNIASLFQQAKKNAPCIVFIDEIDVLLKIRNEENSRGNFVAEFLFEIDGPHDDFNGVLLIGATNRLSSIDPAMLRPGRLDKKIFIDNPNLIDREKILQYYLSQYKLRLEKGIKLIDFAEQLDGFSGADIKGIISYIQDILSDLNIENNENYPLTADILCQAYKKFKEENQKDDFKFIQVKDKKLNIIAGYKGIKEEMQEIILQLQQQNNKRTKLEGIILTGPPGTGKTNFARVIACESELPLLILSVSDLIGKYVGESEQKLITLFENIRKNSPCIIFIDEMESLFSNRDNNASDNYGNKVYLNIINTFLHQIDGAINPLKGVLFIGATNYINQIDPALTRPGRMSNIITLSLPQYQDRLEIINHYIQKNNIKLSPEISIEYLAERSNGDTPADIEKTISLMQKLAKKENKIIIDKAIVSEAVQQMALGKKDNSLIMSENTIKQTAYHEACHGLFQFLLYRDGKSPYKFDFLTIEPRQKTLGVAYGRMPAEYLPGTKERYLGQIAIALAGKAAQEVFFNSLDSGASSDLIKATEAAINMVTQFGMGKKLRVFNISKIDNNLDINSEVEEILQDQYKKVINFITTHKDLINTIVDALFEKKILYENQMSNIIENYEKHMHSKITYSA